MIILYGKLRKLFGKSIGANVNSVQELMRAAEANRPGFTSAIDKGRSYIIKRGSDFRTAKEVDSAEVEMRFSENVWHVLPMPIGSSGAARVIVGAVLIVAGAVSYFYGGSAFSAGMIKFGLGAMKVGLAVSISGVAQMLAPSPSVSDYGTRESPDQKPSYLFDGPTNRVAAGGAVPLVFGFNVFVGSTFLSGGLEIGDIA